jgi:hypothetical protein
VPRVPACSRSPSSVQSSAPRRLAALASSLLLVAALLTVSCADDTRPLLAAYDKPEGVPRTLQETFNFLRRCRDEKSYLALRPYVVPSHRDEIIDLLLAVDAFNLTNAAALETATRVCPDLSPGQRDWLDLSRLFIDQLEIFSHHVEVVAQREDRQKGEAIISLRIPGHSSLEDADFRLREGYWLYDPGPDVSQLSEILRAHTKALERVNRSLTYSEILTFKEVEDQYRLFIGTTKQRTATAPAPQ